MTNHLKWKYTPENVGKYLPYVDIFIVATGISKGFYELDRVKVEKLVKEIKNY